MKVRIGTRGSDLALWQANHVATRLETDSSVETEIQVIKTQGDAIDVRPLQQIEGKSFFTAEIEKALLDGDVDLAVHSHKDLATESPAGLVIIGVPQRGPVAEVLLVRESAFDGDAPWLPLAPSAKVGTSAPRRRAQLLALRPDLEVADLRGNVPTRVRRCQDGSYDAVVLAAAGVERLNLPTEGLVSVPLAVEHFVPAPAQGALAIQIRADDEALAALCKACLHDDETEARVHAERLLLQRLGGGCHMPLGVLVDRIGDAYQARAFLGTGVPTAEHSARWAIGVGASALAAADAVYENLMSDDPTGEGPLAGLTVVLVGASQAGTTLGARLDELGARVEHEQVLRFEGVGAPDLPAKMARLARGDVLAVTSQEAARRLVDARVPQGVVVAAVGPATAAALSVVGIRPDKVGSGGARALAESLEVAEGGKVLFACAEQARPDLPQILERRGVRVDRVVLYRTVSEAVGDSVEGADVRIYMSPSAVASSVVLGREATATTGSAPDMGSPLAADPTASGAPAGPAVVRVGLGGSTCDALQDEGLPHERPSGSGPEATVALLSRLFSGADAR